MLGLLLVIERLPALHLPVRLLGVGVSGFETPGKRQLSLFNDGDRERDARLDAVSDQIKQRFGTAAMNRASGLLHNAEHKPVPRPGDAL